MAQNEPETAAAITRAVLKAARYVQDNPYEAGELIVEKGYVLGSGELNGTILAGLDYTPSVKGGYEAMQISYKAGKDIGVIEANADIAALMENAFIELPNLE